MYCRQVQEKLQYSFRRVDLLTEALTHCSLTDTADPCYQRLEFLGDAALDFLISRYYILGYRCHIPASASCLNIRQ